MKTTQQNIIRQNRRNLWEYFKSFGLSLLNAQNTQLGLNHYQNMTNKPILFVENLYKKYPRKKKPAINNISFNVYPGQFHAFIGANGAGKTTSIKSIIAAYARWSGTVLINGKKNTSIEAKKYLGYIPENAKFPTKMNCFSYLVWMARLSGLTRSDARRFAKTRLIALNMWNLRNKSPNSFSSGQKKKVLLAQALINNPHVLVMDEPAANLDPKARLELFEILGQLTKEGKAILISSHVLAELDKYANAATILDGGKIVFSGTIKELYSKYSDRQLAIKVSSTNRFRNLLKKNVFDFTFNEATKTFYIKVPVKKVESDLLQLIQKSHISILALNETGNKLDDIYKKLVKLGSVDTMNIK